MIERNLLICLVKMAAVPLLTSCASDRTFWDYVVEDKIDKPLKNRAAGKLAKPGIATGETVRVVYNDGSTRTEVFIPVLSSGQQVIVEHKGKPSLQGASVNPLPPNKSDKSIEKAYVSQGRQLNKKSASVSISRSHKKIRELTNKGEYELALQYVDRVLARYPQHLKSLKAKGSILLQMGEKQAALDAYLKAQALEEDPSVQKLIESIENSID